MKKKENKEKGSASIMIELVDGKITISHGEGWYALRNPRILAESKSTKEGDWNKIWESLLEIIN